MTDHPSTPTPAEENLYAADPCFLLRVIRTPDDVRRTLTAGMYPTPAAAMLASECEVWTREMFPGHATRPDEWRSDDGEWIIRRAMIC